MTEPRMAPAHRSIYNSPLPDVEVPDLPLTSYVLAGAAGQGDKPALIDGLSGQVLTYAGLEAAVGSLAGGLAANGFAKGDVLALMAPNMPEYAVVFHAAAMAGGIVTTINPTYTEAEVHDQLRDSGARILVTTPPLVTTASGARAGTRVEETYVLGEVPGAKPLASLFGVALAEAVPVGPDDVVALPYSSGTTGFSKGVMLTHRNLVANIAQTLASAQIGSHESLVAVLPFFHIYGMQVLMNCGLRAGATVVTLPRFDLEQFLQAHQDHQITRSFVAPPIVVALAKHPLVTDAAVIGLPDEEAGEIPVGYITLRPGTSCTPEEIQRFVASHVASYKQIRRLEVIEAIPKSAAGKILRRVLRDAATAQADPPARRPEK